MVATSSCTAGRSGIPTMAGVPSALPKRPGRAGVLHLCRSHDVADPVWWDDVRDWGVVNLPAIVFFRNGSRVETVIGLRPVADLEDTLSRWADIV